MTRAPSARLRRATIWKMALFPAPRLPSTTVVSPLSTRRKASDSTK